MSITSKEGVYVTTGQEMCELISEYWASRGFYKTWEEIWNYSSTGELFMVYVWYNEALEWKKTKEDK